MSILTRSKSSKNSDSRLINRFDLYEEFEKVKNNISVSVAEIIKTVVKSKEEENFEKHEIFIKELLDMEEKVKDSLCQEIDKKIKELKNRNRHLHEWFSEELSKLENLIGKYW